MNTIFSRLLALMFATMFIAGCGDAGDGGTTPADNAPAAEVQTEDAASTEGEEEKKEESQ